MTWMAVNRTRDIVAETTGGKRHPLFFLRTIIEPSIALVGRVVMHLTKDTK